MGEWASYTLQDMLLFSSRVYFRQFELANELVWPVQFLFIAAGLFAAFAMWCGNARLMQFAMAMLAVCVTSSAWAYLHTYYSEINWAMVYMVPLFVVQTGALLSAAATGPLHHVGVRRGARRLAAGILALVAVAYPLLALTGGRSMESAEIIGVAADPTMLAVLMLVAVLDSRWRWVLAVVPLVWCLFSILTLHTMGSEQYLLVLGLAIAGVIVMTLPRSR